MTTQAFHAPISVVIPAYNAAAFLGDAIRSVQAQTLPVLEIIVVDDGSTDQTAAIASALHVRVIRQEQRGTAAARNAGIRAAAGQWIAFLDADDLWEPEKIAYQYAMITLCPAVGIVSSDYATMENGQVITPSSLTDLGNPHHSLRNGRANALGRYFPRIGADFFSAQWVLLPSTVMIRRAVLEAVGLFDESLRAIEDFECFLRVMARYPLAVVTRPLMRYRLHGQNLHFDWPLMRANLLKCFDLMMAKPLHYPPGAREAALRGRTNVLRSAGYHVY